MAESIEKIELTEEQKAKAEKIGKILSDPDNQSRIKELKTADDVFAFYSENGIEFSEEEKQKIQEYAEVLKEKYASVADVELSDDQLEQAAGGNWLGSFLGSLYGGVGGVGLVSVAATNPGGWMLLAGGLIGAGIGYLAGGY